MIRMKVIIAAVAIPLFGAVSAEAGGYVAGIGDLPLMGGLDPMDGEGLVFDKPSGRIVLATAAGPVAAHSVRAFYAETLPHLGWRAVGADRFRRDGEVLALEFSDPVPSGTKPLTVRFFLSPE